MIRQTSSLDGLKFLGGLQDVYRVAFALSVELKILPDCGMTAKEFARLVKARKIGDGKWFASCPVHREKTASLSIRAGKTAILLHCFGCGADGKQVMKEMGLKSSDLFYATDSSPQVRARTSIHERQDDLQRQLGLVIWLKALESGTQSRRKSDASYRRFDAALSRWQSTVNGAAKSGK